MLNQIINKIPNFVPKNRGGWCINRVRLSLHIDFNPSQPKRSGGFLFTDKSLRTFNIDETFEKKVRK